MKGIQIREEVNWKLEIEKWKLKMETNEIQNLKSSTKTNKYIRFRQPRVALKAPPYQEDHI
jgi:hypothetical protein